MKKITFAAIGMALLGMSLGFTSCNDNDGEQDYSMYLAFVTYKGSSETASTFTTRENGDSPLITFTSTYIPNNETYPVGDRYIIGYNTLSGERYVSGPIQLIQLMKIVNGKVETATLESINSMNNDLASSTLVQREGTYINLETSAPISRQPQMFGLYVDDTTADDAYPQVYLGFKSDNTGAMIRTFYASISIESLWEKPTCKGIVVHYYLNGAAKEVTFDKESTLAPVPDPVD